MKHVRDNIYVMEPNELTEILRDKLRALGEMRGMIAMQVCTEDGDLLWSAPVRVTVIVSNASSQGERTVSEDQGT